MLSRGYRPLFFIAYALLIISSVYAIRQNEPLYIALYAIRSAALLGITALWIANSTVNRYFPATILIACTVLIPYLTTDAWIIYIDITSLAVAAYSLSKDKDAEEFLVFLSYSSLALVLSIILLNKIGYIPEAVFEWQGRVKSSLGFSNPNTLYFYIFSSAAVFFMFGKKNPFLFCGFVMLALFPSVGNRTFLLSYIVMLILYFILNPKNDTAALRNSKELRILLWIWLISIVSIGSVIAIYPIGTSDFLSSLFGLDINEIFSNRLYLVEAERLDWSLMNVLFGGKENNTDSLFVYFLSGIGAFGFLSFLTMLIYSIKRTSERNKSAIIMFASIFFTVGLVEVPFDGSTLIGLVFVYLVFFFDKAPRRSAIFAGNGFPAEIAS